MTPIDLELAAAGYLRSPDGRHLRHIIGLDRIAQDALAIGAQVCWCDLPGHHAGCCDGQRIYLAPWVFWSFPWFLKVLITHELGHVAVGVSDERVRLWQMRAYKDLLEPIWA